MQTQIIDQSLSEPRLHRVLYLVKYLRAMILNLFLVMLAVVLFLVSGLDVYPSAIESIKALTAQKASLQGNPLGSVLWINVSLTAATLVAFFLWMYLSLVHVWRKSLRFQALFLLTSVVGDHVLVKLSGGRIVEAEIQGHR